MSHPLVEKIKEVAEANPEKRAACVYVHLATQRPECIVGVALVALGVDVRDLMTQNEHYITERAMLNFIERNALPPLTGDDLRWAGVVQRLQDGDGGTGLCWGDAVKYASGDLEREE